MSPDSGTSDLSPVCVSPVGDTCIHRRLVSYHSAVVKEQNGWGVCLLYHRLCSQARQNSTKRRVFQVVGKLAGRHLPQGRGIERNFFHEYSLTRKSHGIPADPARNIKKIEGFFDIDWRVSWRTNEQMMMMLKKMIELFFVLSWQRVVVIRILPTRTVQF